MGFTMLGKTTASTTSTESSTHLLSHSETRPNCLTKCLTGHPVPSQADIQNKPSLIVGKD